MPTFFQSVAYLFKDILWLRLIIAFAFALDIIYIYFFQKTPDWMRINWDFVYIIINLLFASFLIKELLQAKLTSEEKTAHKEVFPFLTKSEFYKLVKISKFQTLPKGSIITEENKSITQLTLIFDGDANILKNNHIISHLRQFSFIGEMAFTTNRNASATVITTRSTKVFIWDFAALKELFNRIPPIRSAFQTSVGIDMAYKLLSTE